MLAYLSAHIAFLLWKSIKSIVIFTLWLVVYRWFGKYVKICLSGVGITLISKIISIALIWGTT